MAIDNNIPEKNQPLNEDINKVYSLNDNAGYDPFAQQQNPQPVVQNKGGYDPFAQSQQPQNQGYQQQQNQGYQPPQNPVYQQPQYGGYQQQPYGGYQQPQYGGYQQPNSNLNVNPVVINSNQPHTQVVGFSATNDSIHRRNRIITVISAFLVLCMIVLMILRFTIIY